MGILKKAVADRRKLPARINWRGWRGALRVNPSERLPCLGANRRAVAGGCFVRGGLAGGGFLWRVLDAVRWVEYT